MEQSQSKEISFYRYATDHVLGLLRGRVLVGSGLEDCYSGMGSRVEQEDVEGGCQYLIFDCHVRT